MMEFPSMPLSKFPPHIKIKRGDNKNSNASSERSPVTEVRTNPTVSTSIDSPLPKNKVSPYDSVQPHLLSFTSATPRNEEAWSPKRPQNSRATSPSTKPKCSKIVGISFATLVTICALGGLAIGLYFLISNSISTATTTTTTTTVCTQQLCWSTSGVTVIGTGSSGSSADHLNNPFHLLIDSSGSFYVADLYNHRIQKFIASSSLGTTVAGQPNGQGGSSSLQLNQPKYLLRDSSGNMYVMDSQNYRVQYFASGSMTGVTRAGPVSQGSGTTQWDNPNGLALDSSRGILYISDTNNHRIWSYPSSGGTVVGTIVFGNGQGSSNTQLSGPMGLYFDASSNSLYIANYYGHTIVRWVVNATIWTLVAGNSNGQSGTTSIALNSPSDITFDSMGNLYVADCGNHRVQFFLAGQMIGSTIAGVTSVYSSAANTLYSPQSIALDNYTNLYVVDSGNNRIQKFQRLY